MLITPDKISSHLKGIISILLDYFSIERRKYFNSFEIMERNDLGIEKIQDKSSQKSD